MTEPAFEQHTTPESGQEYMDLRERNMLQGAILKLLGTDVNWLLENREVISNFVDGRLPKHQEKRNKVWELVAQEKFEEAAHITIETLGLEG